MQNLKDQLSNTVQEVLDGNFDPLEAYGEINELKKYIETCIDAIKASAINDAKRYESKTFKHKQFEITLNEGRKTYDFKSVESWVSLQNNLKAIEETAKIAADMWVKGKQMVDENGEVIQPCIIKYSEPYLSIKPVKN